MVRSFINQMRMIMAKKVVNETVTETKKKGWRVKRYYVDPKVYEASVEALSTMPNQVRIMMKHFYENFNKPELADRGLNLCQHAIDHGGLKTVIEPAVLFAYYRAKMEPFGLTLVD